jgi:hypothetical protein
MNLLGKRPLLVPALAAVALWISGLVVTHALSGKIPSHPTDAQLLAWFQGNQTTITLGGWLWMIGCLAFLGFASFLRARLADAEGGQHAVATLAYAGAAAATVFGMLVAAGDVGAAIDHDSISAATAGTMHNLGDMFFVSTELALIPFFAGTAVVALRTSVLPRWWAIFSLLIAVVLLIGPIGWAALIFGTPVWVLGTGLIVGSKAHKNRHAVAVATA